MLPKRRWAAGNFISNPLKQDRMPGNGCDLFHPLLQEKKVASEKFISSWGTDSFFQMRLRAFIRQFLCSLSTSKWSRVIAGAFPALAGVEDYKWKI